MLKFQNKAFHRDLSISFEKHILYIDVKMIQYITVKAQSICHIKTILVSNIEFIDLRENIYHIIKKVAIWLINFILFFNKIVSFWDNNIVLLSKKGNIIKVIIIHIGCTGLSPQKLQFTFP